MAQRVARSEGSAWHWNSVEEQARGELPQPVIEEVILRGGGHHALAHRARQRGEDHGGIGVAGMVDRQNERARLRNMLQPFHAQAAVEAYKRHKWPAHQLKARDWVAAGVQAHWLFLSNNTVSSWAFARGVLPAAAWYFPSLCL